MQSNLITAVYCRTASESDEGIAAQETMLRSYAENHGYGNVTVYVDNGYNGLNFDRHAFTRLDGDIKAGRVGAVIVKDMTRISRNINDTFAWVDKTRAKGVKILSVMDNLCTESPNEPFDTIRRAFAEYIAKQKGSRHRAATVTG